MSLSCCHFTALLASIVFCAGLSAQQVDWSSELAQGHAQSNGKPLERFLNDWLSLSKPVSDELIGRKPKIEQTVYELYSAFFKPPEEHYKNVPYAIIQSEIDVVIVDSDLKAIFGTEKPDPRKFGTHRPDYESETSGASWISSITIRHFRPRVGSAGKKILYLDDARLAAMVGFLMDGDGWRILDSYRQEDSQSKERQDRLEYLNSVLRIFPGHWGNGWHFETHPYIRVIYLSSDLERAVVRYRIYYGGGNALMSCSRGEWEVISWEDTWVE